MVIPENWDEARLLREFSALSEEISVAQREIAKKNVSLQHIVEAKDRVLRIAAHDLRSPLGAIALLAQCLDQDRKADLSPEHKRLLSSIEHSARHMVRIVEGLLDVTVLQASETTLQTHQKDLTGVLEHSIALYKIVAERKQIKLIDVLNGPAICDIDSTRIEQVSNNLLSNAIAYSPYGSEVHISMSCQGNDVTVSVSDEGCGIPEQDLSKLFKPFPEISAHPTGNEKSVGLGLTICKSIISSHGGRIRASSVVGQGSTFEFTLPLVQ